MAVEAEAEDVFDWADELADVVAVVLLELVEVEVAPLARRLVVVVVAVETTLVC